MQATYTLCLCCHSGGMGRSNECGAGEMCWWCWLYSGGRKRLNPWRQTFSHQQDLYRCAHEAGSIHKNVITSVSFVVYFGEKTNLIAKKRAVIVIFGQLLKKMSFGYFRGSGRAEWSAEWRWSVAGPGNKSARHDSIWGMEHDQGFAWRTHHSGPQEEAGGCRMTGTAYGHWLK